MQRLFHACAIPEGWTRDTVWAHNRDTSGEKDQQNQ